MITYSKLLVITSYLDNANEIISKKAYRTTGENRFSKMWVDPIYTPKGYIFEKWVHCLQKLNSFVLRSN